ncbi:putative urea ABC transporter substrate-binding protein [Plasticicumulans acidivorans]|uniref:NitT/TauT family transport system substrate-binding protein n=1 Tax=Plasticicumulans acidivorans TaxID=886464 RepID=A0A317N4K2_9GAMM|nr:putative urea ABC transporter substrate-binding protein [Plasticicumulans acidivorans]PWV65689.1 NitT/TauT family transport system substrate-binding protein [Plasticicumulans acidivorans]
MSPSRSPQNLLSFARRLCAGLLASVLLACALISAPAQAAEGNKFRVAWTIYAGWMPWDYAAFSGIVDKWAKKYGIQIEVVQINDYVESINQYTAGAFDGCVMTNMDALTIPAVGGVDSTALIVGDFSNGNDGVVLKGKGAKLADIKGRKVNLVELSVSHYLLARALESVGLSEKDLQTVNTSDADIVAAWATPEVEAVVTWNPLLAEVKATPQASEVFDSSKIPGEIIDMMVVNTATLQKNPALGKALVGAWYEVMQLMSGTDAAAKAARSHMAQASGTDLAGYDAQLATTRMFYTAKDAVEFTNSAALPTTMNRVAAFSFAHGLLGEGAANADVVGMSFPGGKTVGDAGNVKLRFDPTYMALAADGKL